MAVHTNSRLHLHATYGAKKAVGCFGCCGCCCRSFHLVFFCMATVVCASSANYVPCLMANIQARSYSYYLVDYLLHHQHTSFVLRPSAVSHSSFWSSWVTLFCLVIKSSRPSVLLSSAPFVVVLMIIKVMIPHTSSILQLWPH